MGLVRLGLRTTRSRSGTADLGGARQRRQVGVLGEIQLAATNPSAVTRVSAGGDLISGWFRQVFTSRRAGTGHPAHRGDGSVRSSNASHSRFPRASSFIAPSGWSARSSRTKRAPLMEPRSRCDRISSASGSPATAGGFARSAAIARHMSPVKPDGHLFVNSGSDLSRTNVGSKATDEIFPRIDEPAPRQSPGYTPWSG